MAARVGEGVEAAGLKDGPVRPRPRQAIESRRRKFLQLWNPRFHTTLSAIRVRRVPGRCHDLRGMARPMSDPERTFPHDETGLSLDVRICRAIAAGGLELGV